MADYEVYLGALNITEKIEWIRLDNARSDEPRVVIGIKRNKFENRDINRLRRHVLTGADLTVQILAFIRYGDYIRTGIPWIYFDHDTIEIVL